LRLLKELLVFLAVAAVAVVAAAVVWQREPWVSEGEREHEWIEGYAAWRGAVEEEIIGGTQRESCATSLDRAAGSPPTQRTRAARRAAVDACVEFRNTVEVDELTIALEYWTDRHGRIEHDLWDGLAASAATATAPMLAAPVSAIAGPSRPDVLCWADEDWQRLAKEFQLLHRDEFRLAGYADPARSQIHLGSFVCEPLRRFFGGSYAPFGNTASFELAEALVVLAHEAEHLRQPDASEAEVECAALQRVRGLVTDAGRSPAYAEEMAGLAFEAGYPLQAEDYRTTKCVDGGPLDLHPETDVWP
jgi:hypothetical protein